MSALEKGAAPREAELLAGAETALAELDQMRVRLLVILRDVAEPIRKCRACGRMLYFVRSKNTGKRWSAPSLHGGECHRP